MSRSWPDAAPRRGEIATVRATAWDLQELRGFCGPAAVDQDDLEELREREREEAYRRGRADGEQAALARARREVETALGAARRVLEQVREARDGWERSRDEDLVALATAIARQIVGRELQGDLEAFRALIRKAASAFPMDHAVKVRLHPSDLALLAEATGGHAPAPEELDGREARWVADEDVVPGGCLVEGPDRIVDGRVDEALNRIYRELTHG